MSQQNNPLRCTYCGGAHARSHCPWPGAVSVEEATDSARGVLRFLIVLVLLCVALGTTGAMDETDARVLSTASSTQTP